MLGALHLDGLAASVRRSILRFPLVCVVLVALAVAGYAFVDDSNDTSIRLFVAGSFAVPALVATALRRETSSTPLWWILDLAVVGVAVGFAAMWPSWTDEIGLRRLVQANLGGLLAVAALPFVGASGKGCFWPFNRTLFVRFVVATIFAGVLYGGLALAIAALETLFDLAIPDDVYGHLFVTILTLFHPLYVLGGIPDPLASVDGDDDLPAPLRVFAQYILMPLVTIYLVILLLYLGRVVLTQQWPQGWIGILVSAVAAAGLLAVLLLDPIARRQRESWIGVASRVYFAAMIPALVMLLMAVGKRVAQYGITENRYFLAALAGWMLVLCIARTVRLWSDPRWIPATLALVVIGTSVGPWGAYGVSRSSQQARLVEGLEAAGRLRDGVAVADSSKVDADDATELRSSIRYLVATHGRGAIDPWFASYDFEVEGDARSVSRQAYRIANEATRAIGISTDLVAPLDPEGRRHFDFSPIAASDALSADGVDWIVPLAVGRFGDQTIGFGEVEAVIELEGDHLVARAQDALATELFAVDLAPVVGAAHWAGLTHASAPPSPIKIDFRSTSWSGWFVVRHANGWRDGTVDTFERIEGLLALRRR